MSDTHRRRILVATDDMESGRLVQAILSEAGFAVGLVEHQELTTDQIEAGEPGLVLVDTLTPILAEWPILGQLVELPHPPSIVVLSGPCVSPVTLAALSHCVCDHLTKPFAAEELVQRCARVLGEPSASHVHHGDERRGEPRRRFLGQAAVLTEKGKPFVAAEVYDISLGGARLDVGQIPQSLLVEGAQVRLAIGVPPNFEPAEVRARVEWHRGETVGVRFVEFGGGVRQRLETWLLRAPRR